MTPNKSYCKWCKHRNDKAFCRDCEEMEVLSDAELDNGSSMPANLPVNRHRQYTGTCYKFRVGSCKSD